MKAFSKYSAVFFSIIVSAISIFSAKPAAADVFYSEKFGYFMDIPEAYKLEEQSDNETSIFFSHSFMPVSFAIKIYEATDSAENTLKTALSKLKAKSELSLTKWNNLSCAISDFSFALGGITNRGYAAAIPVNQEKAIAVLLCYTADAKYAQFSPVIVSTIDSFMTDKKGFTKSGIITSFAYPGSQKKEIQLNVNGKTVKTSIDKEDAEAADFVVNYEYKVLLNYASHPMWKEAWQRYYRMIFKDSYSRLNQVSVDLYKAVFPAGVKNNPQNPETGYIQELLTWTQSFQYSRDRSNTDFTDLVSAISGKGSDCDSRALFLCVIARHAGINSALFISREYSHAVAGFDLEGPGARIDIDSTAFLLGETTAKNVKLGLIAKDMSDTKKWIPVELP